MATDTVYQFAAARETDLTKFDPQRNNPTVPTPTGLMKRLQGAVSGFVSGFWTPGTPLDTVPPDNTPPRQFDYQTTFNIDIAPRSGMPLGFQDLMALADNWDLLRMVIERRKDQMAKLKWSIRPRDQDKELDAAGQAIQDQLRYPDNEHSFETFMRASLEEVFVKDALSLEPVYRPDGSVYGIYGIDGSTIQLKIDERGRTPEPPNTAYQQVIKGVPWANFTKENLIYRPWNLRFSRVFGFSKVEQIAVLCNIGLRREMQQLYAFTEGTLPEAFMNTPKGWGPQQIKEFQDQFDSYMTGNLKRRSKIYMVPDESKIDGIKADPLKNEFDEWLARLVCYIFGMSPQGFVKETNRATAETAAAAAASEGLEPVMSYVQELWTYILAACFKRPDLEFAFNLDSEIDAKEESDIQVDRIEHAVYSVDEVRQSLGLDKIGFDHAVWTPSGPILVSQLIANPTATLPQASGSAVPDDDSEPMASAKAAKAIRALLAMPKGHLPRLPMPDGKSQKKNSKLSY